MKMKKEKTWGMLALAAMVTWPMAAQARPSRGSGGARTTTANTAARTTGGSLTTVAPAGTAKGNLAAGKTQGTDGGMQGRKPGTSPKMSEQQQANLKNLQNDLLGIKADSQVTQEQKDALAYSLMAMADGATKPSQESVDKLASDLSEAMADGTLANREKVALANDVAAVMNSANIPQSEVEAAVSAAQALLTASGISKSDVQVIVNDLKAIGTEAKKNAGAAKDSTAAKAGTAGSGTAAGKAREKLGK